ncbi:unnamed protein product [Closterium sp. NIES-53]
MHLTTLPCALTQRRSRVPPARANIVDGMWIFRVKQPPGSPPAFKARYVARGFSQRYGVDFFQTFSPTPKMTTLRVLLHVAAQRDYELHSLEFSTAFLQGSLHEEIWLRRPPGFTGSTTLAALGFAPSSADPSLFLRTDTSLPPFYIIVYVEDLVFATADTEALALVKVDLKERHTCTDLGEVLQRFGFQFSSPQPTPLSTGHSLSAPPFDEFIKPSGPYLEVVGCLITSGMGLVLEDGVQWYSQDTPKLLGPMTRRLSVHHQVTPSALALIMPRGGPLVLFSVIGSSCEAEIYAGAMAAQELHWLTYLLTDLGERPCSPSILYVDNKAVLALCHEQRVEHRTKHIALCYFLAHEL